MLALIYFTDIHGDNVLPEICSHALHDNYPLHDWLLRCLLGIV